MKFWLKIEALINKVLLAISQIISIFISKITPNKVKKTIDSTKKSGNDFKISTEKSLSEKYFAVKSQATESIKKTKDTVEISKRQVQKTVIAAKTYNWKALNITKVIAIVLALFTPLLIRLKAWALSLQPSTVITITISTAVISLTGISIVQQAGEIKEKTEESVAREPASYQDSMQRSEWRKSKYHKYEARSLNLSSVAIPIYIEAKKGMESVLIDFTFVASNRYIAKYFKILENEYILRDRLNQKLQPIIPSFPMEKDGKKILKNKIINEMNDLIKELKIKGHIEDIFIHSLLNG